jgi:hypothetical protein
MRYFGPQADIYGLAATLYSLFTGDMNPITIEHEYEEYMALENMNCSDAMKKAIIEGLAKFANDRPANAQMFLNLFPGCEDIKLD